MFLIKRHGRALSPTPGKRSATSCRTATRASAPRSGIGRLHLNTLFPEARLKSTLEVRSSDSLPSRLGCAVPALFTGILYDEQALAEADAFAREIDLDALLAARPAVEKRPRGARSAIAPCSSSPSASSRSRTGARPSRALNEQGKDERIHLELLTSLVQSGKTPADAMIEGLSPIRDAQRRRLDRAHAHLIATRPLS